MNSPRSHLRWWRRIPTRLSVRALMALVLILAVGLGWVAHRARTQRNAIAAIERAGGKAFYDWQVTLSVTPDYEDLKVTPTGVARGPKWLTDWIGPDYLGVVKLVTIPGPADPVMAQVGQLEQLEEIRFTPSRKDSAFGLTDAGMDHLRGLTRLRHLTLGVTTAKGAVGSKITGKGLAAIASAQRLQILQLQGISLTDPDLAALRDLTDLRVLEIESPNITDLGLRHLGGLVAMRRLSLQGTRVTSAGIIHLRGMTRLNNLNLALTQVDRLDPCRSMASLTGLTLARTPIADAGLVPTSDVGFAVLTNLNLFQTRVSDRGLESLKDLPKLKRLDISATDVTTVGTAGFKQARPTTVLVNRVAPTRSPPTPAAR